MGKITIQPAQLPSNSQSRRRHPRCEIAAVAQVHKEGDPPAVLRVQNLSLGGASLAGAGALIPGSDISLRLQIAGQPPILLAARVLRRQLGSAQNRRGAVSFKGLTDLQSAALKKAIETCRPAREKAPMDFLVVRNEALPLAAFEEDLVRAKMRAVFVDSPLDAAAWLQRLAGQVKALLVDFKQVDVNGWNLLSYLRDEHPAVKRVVLAGAYASFRLDGALRSGLADAALEPPFRLAGLARKIAGVEMPRGQNSAG